MLDFIDDNNVLYDYQYGFRHSHSTQQAIITPVDRITKSLDKGHIAITILLDLKKAFDTVDHRILLRKLYAYGIRGALLKWFESYLTGMLRQCQDIFRIVYLLAYEEVNLTKKYIKQQVLKIIKTVN